MIMLIMDVSEEWNFKKLLFWVFFLQLLLFQYFLINLVYVTRKNDLYRGINASSMNARKFT